ncbi:hypothetical protein SYNPS1DRAFT_27606 [Syncephalis pseudoplumigaleata]|uniref:Uncharacterized protein n=2 Tax=Zoopagomycota TaxID=1913638 RepID=A0A4P9ZPE9_9FUNG|nr:hypothetical protein SYNPS1DRAFT_27606 [Syncephalis pseudoplumigaleata]RKP34452.1 hypothetical protein BJ085DRAFT_28440 [Dimargaris cristalligena]|eukprot:RKP26716.1 hypothetical protein SYNPS1DRAFT_27606 [Syncephalis pseudoplumigaleata]
MCGCSQVLLEFSGSLLRGLPIHTAGGVLLDLREHRLPVVPRDNFHDRLSLTLVTAIISSAVVPIHDVPQQGPRNEEWAVVVEEAIVQSIFGNVSWVWGFVSGAS